MSKIRLALVDQNILLCQSLCAYFESHPDFQVLWWTGCLREAAARLLRLPPDIALVDVDVSADGVFDLARRAAKTSECPKIIILTNNACDALVDRALQVATRGYLLKDETLQFVVDSIKGVAQGQCAFSKRIRERLRLDPTTNRYTLETNCCLKCLTTRQLEILKHLAQGASAKEIARTVHLSVKAVNSHKYRIMQRLNVHDRVDLARYAIREGLVSP
jgi:DNA-binding NarL/FixJ family response regulator